jgi:N utilization substance protein B
MKYTRHQSRQFAIQILYTYEQNQISLQNAIDQVFANYELSNDAVEFVNYAILNQGKIDELISSNLTNYRLDRLNSVDRAILRLATSELLNGTPANVVINEALDLTREFSDTGDNKAVHFNNALLDNINKSLKK